MTEPILSISARTRRTPLHDIVMADGVKAFTVYNHMLLPTVYRGVEADYRHLLEHVQLWDVYCERQVELAGPDAARLLQLMTPRDISRARVGQCLYVPLVDEAGGMVNDPVALKLAEDRWWVSVADSDVVLWARGIAWGLGLDVAVEEPDVGPVAVQGPKADDLMAAVFGEAVRAIRFFRFERLDFRGHPLVVARSGWSKQGGFEIYVDDPALAPVLWRALEEAGRPFDVGPGCPNLIERIEGGLLSYGNDMTRANNPFECGLDRYCNLDGSHDFMARKALEDILARGVARRIRGLAIEGGRPEACVHPWPVKASDGRTVGTLNAPVWSPRLESCIAMTMVGAGHWDAGTVLAVEAPEGTRRATVVDLPFL